MKPIELSCDVVHSEGRQTSRRAQASSLVASATVWLLLAIFSPNSTNAADIQSGHADGVPWIAIEGEIGSGDDETFVRVSKGLDDALVVLNSLGGRTLTAINIGKAIREMGHATLVPKGAGCLSACAMIWLGGNMRFLHPDATLGFHASYIDKQGELRESGASNALVGAYYNSLGLSDMAIMFLTAAPPDSYLEVDAEIAAILGISIDDVDSGTSASKMGLLDNIDLYGYDYERWDNATLEGCQLQCEGDQRCMAFTFNRNHSVCFLKSDAQLGLHNDIAASGYKPAVKSRIYLSNMAVLEQLDLPGGDFRSFRGDFADCFVACSNDPNCKAFSWVHRAESCWLKSAIVGKRARRGVTSGTKVRD